MATEQRKTVRNRRFLERREIPMLPHLERGINSWPAWAISICFHFVLLTTLGLLWVGQPKGTGEAADRPVGIAVVYEVAGQQEYALSGERSGGSQSQASKSPTDSLPNQDSISEGLPSTEELLSDLLPGPASMTGNPSTAVGGLGLGQGGAELGSNREIPKVKTTVFGIEGEGTRFVYVFDRSDSMNGYAGTPLRSAKSELLESLQSLAPVHQFQIIFYNDSPLPFGGLSGAGPRLMTGETASKLAAERFVRDVVAYGGTRHLDALRMALAMAPDVVFFLTDADTAPASRDLDDLNVRASRVGATIHAIQFGAGANQTGGGWIRRLAVGTGGQYRYVDVTQFSTNPK